MILSEDREEKAILAVLRVDRAELLKMVAHQINVLSFTDKMLLISKGYIYTCIIHVSLSALSAREGQVLAYLYELAFW